MSMEEFAVDLSRLSDLDGDKFTSYYNSSSVPVWATTSLDSFTLHQIPISSLSGPTGFPRIGNPTCCALYAGRTQTSSYPSLSPSYHSRRSPTTSRARELQRQTYSSPRCTFGTTKSQFSCPISMQKILHSFLRNKKSMHCNCNNHKWSE